MKRPGMSERKERFCAFCGDSLGFLDRIQWQPNDVCGKPECLRYARESEREERERAHDQLDRDRGWR